MTKSKKNKKTKFPDELLKYRALLREYGLIDSALYQQLDKLTTTNFINKSPWPVEMLISRVQKHQAQEMLNPHKPPFKQPKLTRGDFILGHAWGDPSQIFVVPFDLLSGNVLCMCSSGGGKTWRSNFWFVQAIQLAVCAWSIDLVKREGQRLVNAAARTGKLLIPIDAFELKFNVLQNPDPEAIHPMIWCVTVVELIADALELPLGARGLFQQHLIVAFKESGAMNGGKKNPTLRLVRDRIKDDKDANPQSRAATVQKLDSFLAVTGDMTDYALGWSSVDLMDFNLALSLVGLPPSVQDILLNTLLVGIFRSATERGVSNPTKKIRLYASVDEGNLICRRETGLPGLLTGGRGCGICIGVDVQTPDLHGNVLGNTSTKLLGRTVDAAQFARFAGTLGLRSEQQRFLLHQLVPGRFCIQLADAVGGGGREPFLLQIPAGDLSRVPPPAAQTSTATPQGLTRDQLLGLPAARH